MRRKWQNFSVRILGWGIVLLIFIAAAFCFVEWRIAPVVQSVAAVQGKAFAVEAINQAAADVLEENHFGESEIVTTDADGTLCSVITDTASANRLKHTITLRAQQAITNLRQQRMDIPFGMVLGGELIGASGPDIPVYITLSGTTESDFDESFHSGGINQTVHQLSLNIHADLRILTPSGTISETVSTSVLIAETVIVGKTPQWNYDSDGGTKE